MNINWIYVTKESRPEIGEIILCDLGKEKPFMIARYLENGVEDINTKDTALISKYIVGQKLENILINNKEMKQN